MPFVPELLKEKPLKQYTNPLWPYRLLPTHLVWLQNIQRVFLATEVLILPLALTLIVLAATDLRSAVGLNDPTTPFVPFVPSAQQTQTPHTAMHTTRVVKDEGVSESGKTVPSVEDSRYGYIIGTPAVALATLTIYSADVLARICLVFMPQVLALNLRKDLLSARLVTRLIGRLGRFRPLKTVVSWYAPDNRSSLRYKLYRSTLTLVEFVSASILLFALFNKVSTDEESLVYYGAFALSLHNLLGTVIGLLASNMWLASWMYAHSGSVDAVEFRFSAQERLRSEQAYHSSLDECKHAGEEEYVYAPRAVVLERQRGLVLKQKPSGMVPHPVRESVTGAPEDLFVRCSCCVDMKNMISLRPTPGIPGRDSESEVIGDWIDFRERLLNTRSKCPLESLVDDELDMRAKHHRLCRTCQYFSWNLFRAQPSHLFLRFFINRSPRPFFKVFEHAGSVQELDRSSKDCHFCSLIWHALNPDQQKQLLDHGSRAYADSETQAESQVSLDSRLRRCIRIAVQGSELVVHYGGFRRPRRWAKRARGHGTDAILKQLLGSEDAPHIFLGRTPLNGKYDVIAPNTGSELTFKVIRRWIQSLEEGQTQRSSWIPTRVLDVSGEAVRVVHRDQVETTSDRRYVALSHCWGGHISLTYNDQTMHQFHRGIKESKLSKTFVDAIDLTRRLGLRHLWIDCLCILQGNKADWDREAPTMCNVYMSAHLTVAVVSAWSSTEGIYREHDPLPRSRCFLIPGNFEGDERTAMCAKSVKDARDADQTLNEIRLSRWQSRGWTFQEALLSPRIVYFTHTGVAFQVKDVHRGQTESRIMTSSGLSQWLILEGIGMSPEIPSAALEWHRVWWDWVLRFTSRQLTQATDRAPGIFGLVQLMSMCGTFQSSQRGRYLAGLWEQTLVADLLWYVDIGLVAQRLDSYRAPTWSWISVDGRITNQSLSARYHTGIEIQAIVTSPEPNDTDRPEPGLNLPKGSYIQLRGKLRSMTWVYDEEPGELESLNNHERHQEEAGGFYYAHNTNIDLDGHPDLITNAALGVMPSASRRKVGPRCYPLYVDGLADQVGWFVPDTSQIANYPTDIQCLLINVEPEKAADRQKFMHPWVMRGIALQPIAADHANASGNNSSFQRVGYFELISQSTGVYLPMDAGYGDSVRKRPLRTPPDTDPQAVFKDCQPQTLRIY